MPPLCFEDIDDLTFEAEALQSNQGWLGPGSSRHQRLGNDAEVHLHVRVMEVFMGNNSRMLDSELSEEDAITYAARQCAEHYGMRPAALGMMYAWAHSIDYMPPNCAGLHVALDQNNRPKYVDVSGSAFRVRYISPPKQVKE